MRAVLLHGKRDLRLVDQPVPTPGPGELLVEVKACGICPGDVRAWARGAHPHASLPVNLGHEATGVVVDVGSPVDQRHIGKRVFADGLGGYAELKVVDSWSVEQAGGPTVLPEDLSFEAGVFIEPLADCLFALEECARIHRATVAVVVGCGQMGLQLIRMCALAGVRVLACDPVPARRALAERFGAERTFPACAAAASGIERTGGADCVVLACPDPSVLPAALRLLREGGRCVVFSAYEDDDKAMLDLHLVHQRRLTLVGSRWIRSGGAPRFELYRRAAQLLARGLVDVNSLIEARVGLDEDGLSGAFGGVRAGTLLKAVMLR
jgi:L-iditol 2-dehydrogenase